LREVDIDYTNKTLFVQQAIQRVKNAEEYKDMSGVIAVNGNVVTKDVKNDSSNRVIPLTDEMVSVFRKRSLWIKECKVRYGSKYDHDWDGYFSVNEFGRIMDDKYVCDSFRSYRERVLEKHKDIDRVTFHDLRHSCASWLLFKGVPMKVIQEILGHSSMTVTSDVYTHVSVDKKREALEKLHL